VSSLRLSSQMASRSSHLTGSSNQYGREWEHFPTWGAIFGYESATLELLLQKVVELDRQTPPEQRVDMIIALERGAVVSLDNEGLLSMAATTNGRRAAFASDNALLLMTIFMQRIMQQAWMPPFKLLDYLDHVNFGGFVSESMAVQGVVDGGEVLRRSRS
jgi:hypothetical protein